MKRFEVELMGGSAFGTMVDFRFATVPRPGPLRAPGGQRFK
ncbi:hypothetical protein ACFL5Z_11215 [Planctomycetota bacterium]